MTTLFNPDVPKSLSPGLMQYYIHNLVLQLILVQQSAFVIRQQPHFNVAASDTLTTDIVSTQIEWKNNAKAVLDTVNPKTIEFIIGVQSIIGFLKALNSASSNLQTNDQLVEMLDLFMIRIKGSQVTLNDLSNFAQLQAQEREEKKNAFCEELSNATMSLNGQDGDLERLQTDIDKENAKKLQAIREIVSNSISLGKLIGNIFNNAINDLISSKAGSSTPSEKLSISSLGVVSDYVSGNYEQHTQINEADANLPRLYHELASLNVLVTTIKIVQVQICDYNNSLSTFAFHLTNIKETIDSFVTSLEKFVEDLRAAGESSISTATAVKISTAAHTWEEIDHTIRTSLTTLAG